MEVIEIFGVCVYPFLIFNIKEVIGMFRICMYAFLTWLFFNMNGVIGNVWGMGKNFKVCRYVFLFIWKLQVNRACQKYLLYTSFVSNWQSWIWTCKMVYCAHGKVYFTVKRYKNLKNQYFIFFNLWRNLILVKFLLFSLSRNLILTKFEKCLIFHVRSRQN